MAGSNPVVQNVVKLYQKIPTPLNPLKTRTPTTKLGKVGKSLNPLSPANAAAAAVGTAARAAFGDEVGQRIEYFTMGLPAGVALNVLDAGGSSAADQQELIRQSNEYFRKKEQAEQTKSESRTAPRAPRPGTQNVAPPRQTPAGAPNLGAPPPAPNLPPVGYEVTTPAPARTNPAPVLQEYLQKASQYAAPTDVPLSGFYAAQRQLGSELGSDEMLRRIEAARPMQGMTPDNFKKWAEKNPDLAYREMLRREELAKRGVQ